MTGRPFRVEIAESLEQLEKSLKQARSVSQKERIQMLVWLKSEAVRDRQELANRSGRDRATITRWVKKYKTGGLKGLLEVKKAPGARPKVQGEALEQLKQRLSEPEGFSSYGAIQQWLAQTCQLNLKRDSVYQLVRYKLKAKLKVPRPRSLQQDPKQASRFKKKLPSC